MDGLCLFYERRARYQDGETACGFALETLAGHLTSGRLATTEDGSSVAVGFRVLSRLMGWGSLFCLALGRARRASELARRSLEVLDRPELTSEDTRRERAFALERLAATQSAHDPQAARQTLRDSQRIYTDVGDRWGVANSLAAWAAEATDLGKYDEAKELYDRSLAIRRSLGDKVGTADSLTGLRMIAEARGHLEESEVLAREALAIYREIGDRRGIGTGKLHLASALVTQGRFHEAYPMLEEAVGISGDLGERLVFGIANEILAWCEMNMGLYEAARGHEAAAISILEEVDDQAAIALGNLGLGTLALAEGGHTKARQLLQRSAALFRETETRHEEGLAHAYLALALLGEDQVAQAHRHLYEALQAGTEIGAWPPIVQALPGVALLLAREGERERAVELYALASRYPYVGKSRLCEHVAGRQIAAIAAALPSDVVAAAEERGRERDLDATVAELLEEFEC
jgi:tetratricopeptide (TPR) repeat protein